jgi:hypothetical protein
MAKKKSRKKPKQKPKKEKKPTINPDAIGAFALDGSAFDINAPATNIDGVLLKKGDEILMKLNIGLYRKAVAAEMSNEDMCELGDPDAIAAALASPPAKFPENLLIRAKKKVGMSDIQIANYKTPEELKQFLDSVSPQTNPDAKAKRSKPPKQKQHTERMPDKFEFDSKLEVRLIGVNRTQFDENNLQLELRKINRKYGAQMPVKVVKTVNYGVVNDVNKEKQRAKMLITHFEIFMK